MVRYLVLTLALLATGPLSLEAQQPATAAERVEAAKARAAEAGIPLELLESRIAEGRAKGVSEERIATAIERRGAGLARAREALMGAGVRPTSADLSVGADAIEAGVDAPALRAVIQAARAEDRPVAIAVLSELVRQGLPVQEARDRVTAALQGRGGRLVDLPQRAAADRQARARGGAARPAGAGGGRPDRAGAAPARGGPPAGVPSARPSGAGRPDGETGGRTTPGNGRGGAR